MGITEEQLSHLADDPLPAGLYRESDAVIIRYAQQSTRSIEIDRELYGELVARFSITQIMEMCLLVGMANFTNRFHATFLTDVDGNLLTECDAGACAIPFPPLPDEA